MLQAKPCEICRRGGDIEKSRTVTPERNAVLILMFNINKGVGKRGDWMRRGRISGLPCGVSTHIRMWDCVLSLDGVSLQSGRGEEEEGIVHCVTSSQKNKTISDCSSIRSS